jgi:hypothetical protein
MLAQVIQALGFALTLEPGLALTLEHKGELKPIWIVAGEFGEHFKNAHQD